MTRSGTPKRARSIEELAHVATLYYLEGMDQKQIADTIHVSNSTVSRMLHEAVMSGVVEVRIKHPFPRDAALERDLAERFGLREAWVLAHSVEDSADGASAFGRLGAACLENHLTTANQFAMCWGHTIRFVIENLRPATALGTHVVQMIGSVGTSDAENDGMALARMAANRLGGSYSFLNAPLVVDDADFARALLQQSAIARTLEEAAHAEVALVGLGTMDPASSALYKAGFISDRDIDSATRAGAIGDVCGSLIDPDGQPVESALSDRIVGLQLPRLAEIRHVIGAAYGERKAPIIRAAALGGHINILVTDAAAAAQLLATADDQTAGPSSSRPLATTP